MGLLRYPDGGGTYDDANRLNHLFMFLAEIMAFEAYVSRCLCEKCNRTPRQLTGMTMEQKLRKLLPNGDVDLHVGSLGV